MPKIPTYDQQTLAPIEQTANLPMRAPDQTGGPLYNPEAATSGLKESRMMTASLVQMYNAVAGVGESLSKIGEKFYHIQQTSELTKTETAASKAIQEKLSDFEKRNDYQNFDWEWRKFTEDTKQDIIKNTGLTGPYLDKFIQAYDSHAVANYPKVLNRTRELAIDDYKASLFANKDEVERQIANEPSPERAKQLRQDFEAKVKAGLQLGMLKATEGYKVTKDFLGNLDEAEAKRLVNGVRNGTIAFQVAEGILGNEGTLLNLDPLRRIEYQKQLDIAKHLHKTEKEQTLIDNNYTFLSSKFKDDPDGAIKYLQDPSNLATMGLRIDEGEKLRNVFMAQKVYKDHEIDRQKKEAAQSTVNDFYGLVNQGKPAAALRVMQIAADNGTIGQDDYYKAKKMLTEGPAEVKTDPATYLALEYKILQGNATPNEIMLTGNLSKSDKAGLLSKVFTKQSQSEKEVEQNAKAYIKSQIVVAKDAFGFGTNPEESKRLYQANMALDQYSNEARKNGKPWGPAEYDDYAKRLVTVFGASQEKKIEYMLNSTKTGMPSKLPVVPGVKSTGRKPGESIDAYEKRMGQ
jgi:hypothetical protein